MVLRALGFDCYTAAARVVGGSASMGEEDQSRIPDFIPLGGQDHQVCPGGQCTHVRDDGQSASTGGVTAGCCCSSIGVHAGPEASQQHEGRGQRLPVTEGAL